MMYDLNRVKTEFTEICNKQGVEVDNPISINSRLTRTLGRVCCQYSDGHIEVRNVEFSKRLIDTATDASIHSVIAHEAAHYILDKITKENHGHDAMFQRMCRRIGAENAGTPYTSIETRVPDNQVYEYYIFCTKCDKVIGKYIRKTKIISNIENGTKYMCTCCKSTDLKIIKNF